MSRHPGDDPVRDFLSSALEARVEVRRHNGRVAALESRCTQITPKLTAMPGGGGAEADRQWAALADARAEETEAVREELRRYRAVEEFIARLGNPVHRTILRLRYLEGLSWIRIHQRLYQDNIYYTERHITRLHGRALDEARALWVREHREEGAAP